jgi:hypothetical protein
MQIFLHTPTGLALLEGLDDTTTIADVIHKTGLIDATAWVENTEDPLDLTALVAQTAGDKGHIHINHCRRVDVTINYGGRQKSHGFAPGTTIHVVRQWAVGPDGFDLPVKERPKHEVGVCGTGIIADRNDHIGTLASDCALCLDLAPKDRFQG